MHRASFARPQRWSRRTHSLTLRTTLKNWLARHGTTGRRTHGPRGTTRLRSRRNRAWRRSFIHRSRPRLGNDHSRRGRLRWASYSRGRCRTRRRWRRLGRCRGCGRWRSGWCGCHGWRRRCWWTRRSRYWRHRSHCRLLHRRRNHCRPRGWRWRSWRGYGNRRNWRRRCRLRGRRRRNRRPGRNRGRWRTNGRSRSRSRFLLLGNRFQHIPGARDVRQIDLGLDFFFAAQWARRSRSRRLPFSRAADVGSHFFRFMLLKRTGMGLLLRHPDER